MGMLEGKTAIVSGAGRGIGRAEALLLAAEGAKVIVNDVGASRAGEGSDVHPAEQTVQDIKSAGGEALLNSCDVSSWAGAEALVAQAVDAWGKLDILVNNAGILRDKMSFNMDESDWDDVIRVHLKGHFATVALRRGPLAQPRQGGRGRLGPHHQHGVGGRALRQRRAGQLRRRQGRHRGHDHHPRAASWSATA